MKALLEVKNLTVEFGQQKAVDSISFHVCPNEILGIAGESGSGKVLWRRQSPA